MVMKKSVVIGLWMGLNVCGLCFGAEVAPFVVSNTQQIGSVDAPTIDGGIINSTERAPIHDEITPMRPIKAVHQPIIKVEKLVTLARLTQQPDEDDGWATRTTAKRLLKAALQNGKLVQVLSASKRMGLPASVALVPMVESNYQTHIVSPKGAAGAWQLMPGTAKDYGITPQERFEFTRATDAALHLLSDLHHQFNHWDLAYAAYNAGSRRVSDEIKKNPAARSIDELDLPRETKTYVKRLKAINRAIEGMSNA